ncbi:MAG: hypothetical protein M1834_004928 [Cirrosporium novae-zelandiae]|nr:MAG: hypothetical protein M1834_004928 [Cirrosporium novae-zelandiae]
MASSAGNPPSPLLSSSLKPPKLTLHTYYRSSCSARLRIALNLKHLAYDSAPVNILKDEQESPKFKALNPSCSVPVLIIHSRNNMKDTVLTQSIAALEYLDEAYPDIGPALLPSEDEVLARAHVRELVQIIASDIQPVTNSRVLNRVSDTQEWNKFFTRRGLLAYENLAKLTAGKFSVEDEITLADVCLVPACWNAQRFGVDLTEFPIINRIFKEMEEMKAVKKAHWKSQPDTPEDMRNGAH